MNHLQSNQAIFEVYRASDDHSLINEQTDRDTTYVTISQIQANLKVALEDICKPLQAMIKSASYGINLRKIVDIHKELEQGDASLAVPYLSLIARRPTLKESRDLVIQHSSMVLPDDVIQWLQDAPKDATLIIRDDIAGERSVIIVPITSIDL